MPKQEVAVWTESDEHKRIQEELGALRFQVEEHRKVLAKLVQVLADLRAAMMA